MVAEEEEPPSRECLRHSSYMARPCSYTALDEVKRTLQSRVQPPVQSDLFLCISGDLIPSIASQAGELLAVL